MTSTLHMGISDSIDRIQSYVPLPMPAPTSIFPASIFPELLSCKDASAITDAKIEKVFQYERKPGCEPGSVLVASGGRGPLSVFSLPFQSREPGRICHCGVARQKKKPGVEPGFRVCGVIGN